MTNTECEKIKDVFPEVVAGKTPNGTWILIAGESTIADNLDETGARFLEVAANAYRVSQATTKPAPSDLDAIAEMKWQPIETAPRDGTVIIMAGKTRHAGYDHVGNGHWYKTGKKWAWHNYLGDEPKQPTHWQPLPASPVRTVKAEGG